MNLNWSGTVIKYVLFIFNLLFVISGIIIIAVGVSVKTYYTNYETFLDSQYFSLPNLLIATGSLIFFISFFGCCGAIKENWCMIYTFSVLLIIIFILEFSAGIAGYVLKNKTSAYLDEVLAASLLKYQNKPNTTDPITVMWDVIQEEFECCGVSGPGDWAGILENEELPSSCCKSYHGVVGGNNCTVNSENSEVFQTGCTTAFGNFIQSHAVTLGAVGLGIAFIQLFGIFFACYLSKQIRYRYTST